MPALYFFLRDDDNGQKTPSANNDDYHSYKQVLIITLNRISGGPLWPSTSSRQKSMLSTLILRFVQFYDLFSLRCVARATFGRKNLHAP